MATPAEVDSVELVDYARVLRRRAWLILFLVVLSAGVATAVALRQTPQYAAVATYVVPTGAAGADDLNARLTGIARAQSLAEVGNTAPAVAAARRAAGVGPETPTAVSVTGADKSPFVAVRVTSTSATAPAAVANAYATTLPAIARQLTGSSTGLRLNVVTRAEVSGEPVSPRPRRAAAIGVALGVLVGIGAAFLREALDRTWKDPDALERITNQSVLGTVPLQNGRSRLPVLEQPESARAESYRQIRTNIQFAGPEHTLKTIVVTSAEPGDGKTSVASNVALAFARTGQRVALVDADLRRPNVAKTFALPPGPGLTELLTSRRDVVELLRPLPGLPGCAVLTSGARPGNPSELVGSQRMLEILAELGSRFDVVILDTPPVLPVTDPLLLAVHASGVILVVRLGQTSRERLSRALASVRKLNVPLLGLVANGAVASGDAAYAYRYTYSRKAAPTPDLAPLPPAADDPASVVSANGSRHHPGHAASRRAGRERSLLRRLLS